jgi:hypothetical protein
VRSRTPADCRNSISGPPLPNEMILLSGQSNLSQYSK